jgi:integrase
MSAKIISQYLQAKDAGERTTAPRINLTEALIEGLPTKPYDYAVGEKKVPGLTVRVRKDTGSKTFEVVKKVNGRTARSKVCAHGERPYSKGDESVLVAARAIIAKMDKGVTRAKEKAAARKKAAEKARQSLTIKDACDNYIKAADRAYNTTANYERFRDNHLKDWHSKQLASITEDDIEELFDDITEETGPVAANNVVRFFRAVWKHHRRKYGLGDSPTIIFTKEGDNVKKWNSEERRTRYVHHKELKPWWKATERLRKDYVGDGDLAADYLQFAILTGLRRREITGLKWEDINKRRKTLLIADNKSNRPLVLPITRPMAKILESREDEDQPFQIEEPKRFIDKVTEWCDVPFSSHDLRRTFLSHATAAGIPMPIQKALVNHSRKGDVTDGYIQIDEDVLRSALEKVQNYILSHAGKMKKVTPIKEASNG